MEVVYFLHFTTRRQTGIKSDGVLWIGFLGRTSVGTAAHDLSCWSKPIATSPEGRQWRRSRADSFQTRRLYRPVEDGLVAHLPIGLLPNLDVCLPGWRTLFSKFVSRFWLLTMQINKRLGCFIQGTALRGTKLAAKARARSPLILKQTCRCSPKAWEEVHLRASSRLDSRLVPLWPLTGWTRLSHIMNDICPVFSKEITFLEALELD